MNKKYHSPVRIIGLGLALTAAPLAWAAAPPSASACANVLGLAGKPLTYQICQNNGPTISQCIQNSLASQIPSSTESISAQLQDSNNASQNLAKLDFQCQYLIAYGSQPPSPPPPGGSNPNGGFGSSLKNALGIKPNTSTPAPNAAMNNQAQQLSNIQNAPAPSNKSAAASDSSNDKNNSINWF